MKLLPSLLLCALLVLTNSSLGYIHPPTEITLTPLIILLITALIVSTEFLQTKPIGGVLLIVLFISLNDIGIKLYGGGMHDDEGQGYIHFFMLLGILPAYGVLLFRIVRQPNIPTVRKIIALFLFPLLVLGHLTVFVELGMGQMNDCRYGC